MRTHRWIAELLSRKPITKPPLDNANFPTANLANSTPADLYDRVTATLLYALLFDRLRKSGSALTHKAV
jgi:hypothetical protein